MSGISVTGVCCSRTQKDHCRFCGRSFLPQPACETCGATGVPLDLDTRPTPAQVVCRKCYQKPRCNQCGKRVSRRVLQQPIGRNADGTPIYFRGHQYLCLRCNR
jgi:hypothetical protein